MRLHFVSHLQGISYFKCSAQCSRSHTGTIIKLCEALGVQVRYIVDGTEISGP